MKTDLPDYIIRLMKTDPLWFWPLYFLVLTLVFVVLFRLHRRVAPTIRVPLKPITPIDPYSIAYLRGSHEEVIRTAMIELVADGWIVEHPTTESTVYWIAKPTSGTQTFTKVQYILLGHFFAPKQASSVFCNDVRSAVRAVNEPYIQWVRTERLKNTENPKIALLKGLALASFVGFEILALAKGQIDFPRNSDLSDSQKFFALLIYLPGFVFPFLSEFPHTTVRGKKYLQNVQRSLAPLKKDPTFPVGTLAGVFGTSEVSLESAKRLVSLWHSEAMDSE